MQIDSFDYETIQSNSEGVKLANNSGQIAALKCTRRIKAKFSNLVRYIQSYSIHFVIGSLLVGDIFYGLVPRRCDLETEQACFKHFILEQIITIITSIAIPSIIFGLLLWVTLINLFQRFKQIYIYQRKFFLIVLANQVLMVKVFSHEESLYNYSKLFNILLLCLTLLVFGVLFSIYAFFWVLIKSCYKKKFFHLVVVTFFSLLISYMVFLKQIKTSDNWGEGVVGRKVQDQSLDGQNLCVIEKPEKDWYKLVGKLQDITGNYYDCTQHTFTEFNRSKAVLKKHIPGFTKSKYLAFPRLQDIDYTYNRSYTQEFILKNVEQINDIKSIPKETEYILDTESLTYTIDVKKNESLITQRAVLRKEIETSMLAQGRKLPKNVIVLYIDALSRMRLPVKLPKVFEWFEEFQHKHQQKFGIYQGMRAVSVAAFTWHNILAYFFGVQSSNEDIFANSPYTLLEKATNTKNVTSYNSKKGKNTTTKVLAGDQVYQSFLTDFIDAGYITAMTNTDCTTNPITQESISNVTFLQPIVYDHMGMIHACDPNYFAPNDPDNLGQGPYSILRRCLYGKEMIDYSIEYAQQFMTKYKDEPKFLQMEFIEAHEGTGEVITHMDDKLYNQLKWLEKHQHLEDSVFVFLSDHGMHLNNLLAAFHAEIMYTEIGFPIQILLYTKKLFDEADLKSLQENQQKLTTLFEIHYFYKYLVNVKDSSYFRDNSIVSRKIPSSRSSFDLPMFSGLPLVCKKPEKKL